MRQKSTVKLTCNIVPNAFVWVFLWKSNLFRFLNRVSSRCVSLQYNGSQKVVEVINLPPRTGHEGQQGEQKTSSTLEPRR